MPKRRSVLNEGLRGAAVPKARAAWGGEGVLPRRWSVLKEGLRGAAVPKAQAHRPCGSGSLAPVAVGAQGGPAGGSSPQGPGTPAWGGRGVLPRRWSVLKEGLRGVAVPKAQAHRPWGSRSPAQTLVGAQGGLAKGSSPQGPGTLA